VNGQRDFYADVMHEVHLVDRDGTESELRNVRYNGETRLPHQKLQSAGALEVVRKAIGEGAAR
jgi:hypothetical protein